METGNNTELNKELNKEYRPSWIAYILPFPSFDIFFSFMYFFVIGLLFYWFNFYLTCTVIWGLLALILVIRAIDLFRYRIFLDDEGVWILSGVFPWTRGISGMAWKDVDSAGFFIGFTAWLTKGYRVRIQHSFLKENNLLTPRIKHGESLCEAINDTLEEIRNK